MAEALYELLVPHLGQDKPEARRPSWDDPTTREYLAHLSKLSLNSLASAERQSLQQASHSSQLSLQSLSTRSHRAIISASDHLSSFPAILPTLAHEASFLQARLPRVGHAAEQFSQGVSRAADNALLERRRTAMLLARNVDRLSDILDLPSLLSSAIASTASSSTSTSSGSGGAGSTANYASALDLDGHIKRLQLLYPRSALVGTVAVQAEEAMRGMTSSLIGSLRAPGIKLAAAMRTVGWLRRVAPELDRGGGGGGQHEAGLGSVFLSCRLANLMSMLDALEPLRELADQEGRGEERGKGSSGAWSNGQQTERYLKRYIEIFREHSFAIISMYKSIFPSAANSGAVGSSTASLDPLEPMPSPLSTFPLHLVDLLAATLRRYLPNVRDRSSRESLLTQVLYCAGSLGRLGADFSMIIASLEEAEAGAKATGQGLSGSMDEWVEVMKKHRLLAGRLELLASGIGGGASVPAPVPTSTAA